MKKAVLEEMTILEAVDTLSSMAELNPEELIEKEEGIEEGDATKWLNPKMNALQKFKSSVRSIHHYLVRVHRKERDHLQDVEFQKKVRAIMHLAEEAGTKIDQCRQLFKNENLNKHVIDFEEYRELREYYLNEIVTHFQQVLEKEDESVKTLSKEAKDVLDIEKKGLRDLDSIKKDKNYEFLLLEQEDGRPFYHQSLERHIRLVHEFEEIVEEVDEDPLVKLKGIEDQILYHAAVAIRTALSEELGPFYKVGLKFKELGLVANMNKMFMALFLCSNSRNLAVHAIGKSCLKYFSDFQIYLREVVESLDYLEMLSRETKSLDLFSRTMLQLIHSVCKAYFTHIESRKEMIRFESHLAKERSSSKDFLTSLLEDHEILSNLLRKYPNGPLMKSFDVLRQKGGGFDPMLQGNHPSSLYDVVNSNYQASCLRMPSPTKQLYLHKAECIPEFKGFLRGLKSQNKKYLLINLQDRSSLEEKARSDVLEKLELEAEFTALVVITLPKNTDFYYQDGPYLDLKVATDFIKVFKEQLLQGGYGYFFPQTLQQEEWKSTIEKILSHVHQLFFKKSKTLTRKNRLDFIEIVYNLLILKCLDEIRPDYFSFTCKDAIDIGMAASGSFYLFLKSLNLSELEDREKEFLHWLFFTPALLTRERMVDYQRLNRAFSALQTLFPEMEKNTIKQLQACYTFPLLQKFQVGFKTY